MQYRNFGSMDFKCSALGFGCMRLPVISGDSSNINEGEAISLIRNAIDNGVNYVDTAYPYHSGNSEILVGKALKQGYRDKVKLATKMPVWLVEKYEDFDKYLNEQLEKLQVDYIDFYLLHALNKTRIDKMVELGVFDFIEENIKKGKIKHPGFSFHDNLEVFKYIVDLYKWDFCQIQYNYLDENYQAGKEGLKYASSKGLGVIVMEPLRGGTLAGNPPKNVEEIFSKSKTKRTPAAWGLSWLWNQPEVSLVLSGMNTMEQIKENVVTAEKVMPNSFTQDDNETMKAVKEMFNELMKVKCTACEYCMPCTVGINIPKNFSMYNHYSMYEDKETTKKAYNNLPKTAMASACIECGKCEKQCPQQLPIRRLLKEVNKTLSETK